MFGHCESSDLPLSTRIIQHNRTMEQPLIEQLHSTGAYATVKCTSSFYRCWASYMYIQNRGSLRRNSKGKSLREYGIPKSTLVNYACKHNPGSKARSGQTPGGCRGGTSKLCHAINQSVCVCQYIGLYYHHIYTTLQY